MVIMRNNEINRKIIVIMHIVLFLMPALIALIQNDIHLHNNEFIDFFPIKQSDGSIDVKIEMVDWETQRIDVETHPYGHLQIDALVKESYKLKFKLTNLTDDPISNSIMWMHLGFMPQSKTKFLNFHGPAMAPNEMFEKPLIYQCYDGDYYGPYWWIYGVTDEFGVATFNISFNHDYLSDFIDIWGSIEGITSIEDIFLYMRVFSAPFNWSDLAIDNPEQYVCSRNGDVFDGLNIIENYDFTNLNLQNPKYLEGIIQLHIDNIYLVVEDYLFYDIPYPRPGRFECERLIINVDVIDFKNESVLSVDNFYTTVEIINPSGTSVYYDSDMIYRNTDGNGGKITITSSEMWVIYDELGPGLSTIKMRVEESAYYKSSAVISVPLEMRPQSWTKFGNKNFAMDLIDPFINIWGSSFEDKTLMPFESNFPHLIGKLWFSPDFSGSGERKELSIQDYIKINLICNINNFDGTISEFPLRGNIMLRPGNYDGIMTFDVGLGPEDAFLMGMNCSLNLTIDANYNGYNILKDNREVNLYLLDLQLVENPSCINKNIIWSIYENQFSSSIVDISIENKSLSIATEPFSLGSEIDKYGIKVPYIYNDQISYYSIDSTSELLALNGVSSIEGIVVIGKKGNEYNYEFKKGEDWKVLDDPKNLQEFSTIQFIGNHPDNDTEFNVYYKFDFNFNNNYYSIITLNGPLSENILISWINLNFSSGFLKDCEESYSPLYVKYCDQFESGFNTYQLSYGIDGITSWDENFIIYNEDELGSFIKSVSVDGYPILTFDSIPLDNFTVIYGVRSQYEIGYGFQKLNKTYSDSIRLIYNNTENFNSIINSLQNPIKISTLEEPTLYIGLDDSNSETNLEIYNIPLYYAPEINFTFKLDPLIIDLLSNFEDFNNLQIKFCYVNDNGYNYIFDNIYIPLDYNILKNSLDSRGSYCINYNKNLQSIYDISKMSNIDIYISLSQIGESKNFIPYILLESFTYSYDSHILKMYDKMPNDGYGNLEVKSVLQSLHYLQLFSLPFRDNSNYPQFPKSQFNLLENSEVTIGIEDMPNSTLVSINVLNENSYEFNYLGTSKSFTVNDSNFNMIPNLGLFIDVYNLDNPFIQAGFVNLYNGSSTSQSDILARKHFFMIINPEENIFDNVFDEIFSESSSDFLITYRESYRELFGNSLISPFEYFLSLNDITSLLISYRLNLRDYIEPNDILNPIISINSPKSNQFFNSTAPNFDLSIVESNLDTLCYTLNDGLLNYTCNVSGQIDQSLWNLIDNGLVSIKFYAKDKLGIISFAEVITYKDINAPTSSISFTAHLEQNKVNKSTVFNITADDGLGSGISVIRYKINDSNWIIYDGLFTLSFYNYGDYLISYQAIDAVGNIEEIKTLLVNLVDINDGEDNGEDNGGDNGGESEGSRGLILGYDIYALIGIVSVILVILIKKRSKFCN